MDVVIIDDEAKARSLLKNILIQKAPEVKGIFEAANLKEGVEEIKRHDPDLVLLDIEMPNEQGIEILNYFKPEEVRFDLVFTTAYSEFALQAFEMNAVDYILKPIRPNRLLEVLERVRENLDRKDLQNRLTELKRSLKEQNFNKLAVPVQSGIDFIPLDDIIHLKADGMYTRLYCQPNREIVISKPLKYFEHLLKSGNAFYRPHRSHIMNLKFLKQYVRSDGNYIVLENDSSIPISKEKKDEFLKLVTQL